MSDRDLIWDSLDAVAAHGVDLVPIVYSRFFAANPEVGEIFAAAPQAPNPAMGNMVNEIIDLVADAIDDRTLHSTITSTLTNHVGWGIDGAMYQKLLDALLGAVRDASGEQWSSDIAAAWNRRSALIMEAIDAGQAHADGQCDGQLHGTIDPR